MKIIVLLCLLVSAILILGCGSSTPPVTETPQEPAAPVTEVALPAPPEEVAPEPAPVAASTLCTMNTNCTSGKYCLEGKCQTLAEINKPVDGCTKVCRVKEVTVYTSDKETYTLPPGQGSYAAGGAIDWTILAIPSYCEGESVSIPIVVATKNYGKVYRDNLITLKEGETSATIIHPLVKSITLSLKVEKITAECN